ncbi:asparagine synthase-related protein [Streptomyces sp. NPDC048172]|uniref:asparagine synthase-related protein n=1 Tax=Streptomyces sp. NPDC048172 TaxID=3365505 RepID=UPI0037178986
MLTHASGRPWVVGRWAPDRIRMSAVRQTRVAVAGFCPATGQALETVADRLRTVSDLDAAARRLTGSAHLLASVDGQVRAQGTASGVRALFHARLAGVAVAADRPDTLARLIGAGLDDETLALRLLTQQAPHPLRGRPVWQGVRQVPPGWCLLMERDGTAHTKRWWQPPEPEVPLREGALAVREALTEAVYTRVRAAAPAVSTDQSGGVDSGTITHLAAHLAPGLLTVRRSQLDVGGDDAAWAAHLNGHLPDAEHLLLEYGHSPTFFAGLDKSARLTLSSEPPFWVRSGARLVDLAERVAARGSRLHLCGHGGDEVFHTATTCLHTLVRRHPWTGARCVQDRRALRHWPLWPTVRGLADRGSYASWLGSLGGQLRDPLPSPSLPHLSWTLPVRMPAWTTPDALATVHDLLRRAATTRPSPLGRDRAAHITAEFIQYGGATVRYVAGLMAGHGVDYAAPFLDDRVIEAAMGVQLSERATPRRYKPLLSHAMRGLVPDELLGRATKSDFGEDVFDGLRRHRGTLLDLFDGSLLAGRGLIDDAAVRAALHTGHAFTQTLQALEPTLACEVWLRTLPDRNRQPALAEGAL